VSTIPFLLLLSASPEAFHAREAYDGARSTLEAKRAALEARYRATRPRAKREAILDEAADEVLHALTSTILPAWVGTPWSFNGVSEVPGEDTIACGMFVGTVLAHAGFNLDRIALGRLASEHIAIDLTSTNEVRRYSDRSPELMLDELRSWGPGLYFVGLDFHAGLILVEPTLEMIFIHSTILPPSTVVSEPLDGDNPFTQSRYRVLTRLLDRKMMRRWLLGERFRVNPRDSGRVTSR
jgi:hypothetical protein